MRLKNKIAVITGAGAGLGRTCALLFAKEGATILVADLLTERAEETVSAVQAAGGEAIASTTDVTSEGDVKAMIDLALDRFGRVDVLLNNAGVPPIGNGSVPFEDTTEESWQRVLGVNLSGLFYGCKHVAVPMRENGGGSIIVTSSASAFVGYPGMAIYGASKAGANGLVRGLAVDLGPYNIRVNAICPAIGMAANSNFLLPEGSAVKFVEDDGANWNPSLRNVPLVAPRPPQMMDSAYTALWFASDEAEYISGQCITIDGGQLSRVPAIYPSQLPRS